MHCQKKKFNKNLLNLVVPFYVFLFVFTFATFLSNNISRAAKLVDGTWAQSANPGTTTINFTNLTTPLQTGYGIVLTFPSTATINQGGTNVTVTGQTSPTRTNNTLDNTITIILDGTLDAALPVSITMTDALSAYNVSTYAQESLAINTQTAAEAPIDFGVAIKTNDNTTLVTTQVPLFLTLAVDTTNIQLGTLSTASINEADQSYTINSNNRTGVTVRIQADGALDDGFGNTINAVADGTVTAGSEEYGISVDAVSGMTISAPFDTGDDEIPQTVQDIATTTTEISNGTFDVNYKASITGTTIAGSYDQIVTVTIASNA